MASITLNRPPVDTPMYLNGAMTIPWVMWFQQLFQRVGGASGNPTFIFDSLSPLTTKGDLLSHDGTHNVRVAGNATTTRKILIQTGTGTESALPGWETLLVGDIPDLPASKITSGLLDRARGGTGTDLSGSGGAHFVVMQETVGGDFTVRQLAFTDISGTLSSSQLPDSGVTAGTYGSASQVAEVVLDAKGRATSASNVTIAIAYSQIASGWPSVTAGTGLSGGGVLSGSVTLSLPNTGTAGTYGSATQVPVFTTDAQGRVTGVTNTTITGTAPGGSAGGDLTGTYPNPTLAASGATAGTYGSATKTVTAAVDAKGRITSILDQTVTPAWSSITGTPTTLSGYGITDGVSMARTITAGTGLSGGGTLAADRTLSIANTTVTAASYGSASSVATFTVNAQGQLTAAASTPIAISASQVTSGTFSSSLLPGSFNGFANPSASIGLTAVNGSAATAMRSDAAPALDQSIAPTWTGTHNHAASVVAWGAVNMNYGWQVDNTAWTSRTSSADSVWTSVAYSSSLGIWVGVASSGTTQATSSPDGITWTNRTAAAARAWNYVCWGAGAGVFVAVASTGTGDRVMTSSNGTSWTSRTSAADNNWTCVCWSPALSLFVAVANTGTNRVMTSPDGITWTARTSADEAASWTGVCWSADLAKFVAVASAGTNRVMTSTDGITWTAQTAASTAAWQKVVWSSTLSLFAAVASSNSTQAVMTSPDGVTWTIRTSPATTVLWTGIEWSPTLKQFVIVGRGTTNYIATSLDGVNWVTRTPPATNSWNCVGWGNGIFVAMSITGTGNRVMTWDGAPVITAKSQGANSYTLTIPSTGFSWTGGFLSTSATAGIGYGAGAGGTVTQSTSKSTAVTLNTVCGAITMNNAALAAGTIVSFTLTNSAISATDVLVLNHISGGTPGSYTLNARAASGSATIDVRNNTGGSLSEAIVIQFAVIKAVNA